jgi:hypothetical protein
MGGVCHLCDDVARVRRLHLPWFFLLEGCLRLLLALHPCAVALACGMRVRSSLGSDGCRQLRFGGGLS